MSTGSPFKREKRSRSSSDANNSFVKNVTSRVSGLLPSTITKWFSSPNTSNGNGSALIAESSDSSTEDEAPDSPVTQPPAKRMHFSSPSASNHYIAPETKCTSTNTDSVETFSAVQSPITRSTFRPESKYVSTPLRSPGEDTNTSDHEKDTFIYGIQNNLSSINHSIVKKRRSLFDITTSEKSCERSSSSYNTVRNSNQPHFKPGLFGSPFYPGKTMYGGASSSYMNQANIKNRKDALVNNSTSYDNISISHSSRCVMDLLENYSSPLIEAKRILQGRKSNSSLDTSTMNKQAYKTQELHVPSIATILRLKQKSRLMNTTSAARQLIASHSSSPEFAPYALSKNKSLRPKDTSGKMITKVKARIARIHRVDNEINESDIIEPVTLPTAVLHIDQNNLPKFTLGSIVSKSSTTTTLVEKPLSVVTTINSNTTASSVNAIPVSTKTIVMKDNVSAKDSTSTTKNSLFNFSNPIMLHEESELNSNSLPSYIFDRPEPTVENQQDKERKTVQTFDNENEKLKTITQAANWKCEDCWVSNKAESENCICCGAKKATINSTKNKKCSDCKVDVSDEDTDKCIACKNKTSSSAKLGIKQSSINSTKWKCLDCWVNNDEEVDKCVCCNGKKPISIPAINNKLNNIENEWKCDDCWIKNKNSSDKCAACGGLRTSLKQTKNIDIPSQSVPVTTSASNNLYVKKIKSQNQKWECLNCLVRNDNDRSKCVCCETERPGTVKESEKKSFNFGTNHNTTFKFGIDPKLNVPVKTSEASSASDLEMSVKESETNNNVISKPQTLSFGIPKNSVDKVSDEMEDEKTDVVSKSIFTFGIPKLFESTTSIAPSSSALTSSKIVQDKTSSDFSEKVQEVPNIDKLNSVITETPQKTGILFGIPVTDEHNLSKPAVITFGKTEQTSAPDIPAVTTKEIKLSQNTFTFSASGIKPAENLFATPVTTSTITFSNVQTSSIPSLFQNSNLPSKESSFYQKNEQASLNLSIFNKTETVTTIAAPSSLTQVSSAPVFNFGSNAQHIPHEKPKFNFTFGSSNKTETQTLFSLPTTNVNNNILSGNSLSGTNTISGGIISGGHGLSNVNQLGSISSGNGLTAESSMGGNDSLTGPIYPGNNLDSGSNTSFQPITALSKKENVWLMGANKMSSENNLEMTNNSPIVHPGNLFGTAPKKENVWSAVNNTSNDSLVSLKLNTGNNLEPVNSTGMPSSTVFGVSEKKENVWTSNNSNNLFVSNAGTNMQKTATFTFGSTMQFNSNNVTPAPAFGSPSQVPQQNMFGISNQNNNNQPSLFSNPLQNQTQQNMFGSTQTANNNTMSVGVFGTPNAGTTAPFGTPNPSLPRFEVPSMNPVPTPSFNFGAQQTPGVFGFGQQQVPQGGVYNFGANAMPLPQRQFNIGSAPMVPGRRPMRKAVRRNTPR